MESSVKEELFTEKVKGGTRTYFFDVKKASNGSDYLIITESRKDGEKFKRERVFVFDNDLKGFIGGLKKALKFMKDSAG